MQRLAWWGKLICLFPFLSFWCWNCLGFSKQWDNNWRFNKPPKGRTHYLLTEVELGMLVSCTQALAVLHVWRWIQLLFWHKHPWFSTTDDPPKVPNFCVCFMGVLSPQARRTASFLLNQLNIKLWSPMSKVQTTPLRHSNSVCCFTIWNHPLAVTFLCPRRNCCSLAMSSSFMIEQDFRGPRYDDDSVQEDMKGRFTFSLVFLRVEGS